MKELSIIIPQYKETEEQIKPLLEILNMQENVDFDDFEVVIVNDCSDYVLDSLFLRQFDKLNLRLLHTPKNVGSGLCRQYGVDHTYSKWILFIDADDMIFSVLTISKILNIIENNSDYDIIRGDFLEEIVHDNTSEHSYKINNGITWVHSKVYKREALDKYGVRFPKGIRVNEDSYFNGVVFNLHLKEFKVDDIFTIWRANPNSLTRTAGRKLYLTGYPDFIKSKSMMIDKLKEFVSRETYLYMVAQTMYFFYFNAQDKVWNKYQDENFLKLIDELILEFYEKYKDDFLSMDTEWLDEIYQNTRVKHFSEAKIRERETFEDYIFRIKNV